MTLHYRTIGFVEQCDLGQQPGNGLHMLWASGRGIQIDVPNGWLSLWLPLSGQLSLESIDSHWEIETGRLQVWRESQLRGRSPGFCSWLALAGPAAAWERPLQAVAHRKIGIFPWDGPAPRTLRRLMIRLARCLRPPRMLADADPVLDALCAEIIAQQHDLDECLQRCNGRTLQRRQQTLCRLLRVRHLIRHTADERLDLTRLARSANYSPCHLIRIYRDVFGETPTEYAARLRFDRAWHMVRDTTMPVCEITEALGFESQSAFCRAFKRAFGTTTTQLRLRGSSAMAHAA